MGGRGGRGGGRASLMVSLMSFCCACEVWTGSGWGFMDTAS